jgi:hypothetical protein
MRISVDHDCRDVGGRSARLIQLFEKEMSDSEAVLVLIATSSSVDRHTALTVAADRAGLVASPSLEISCTEARQILGGVVLRDLAYGMLRTTEATATAIVDDFLALFEGDKAQFFTNGQLGLCHARKANGGSWLPLTRATFDTGVAAISASKVGVLWFEDED